MVTQLELNFGIAGAALRSAESWPQQQGKAAAPAPCVTPQSVARARDANQAVIPDRVPQTAEA